MQRALWLVIVLGWVSIASMSVVLLPRQALGALEDVLYESGKISQEEWLRVKEEKRQEAAQGLGQATSPVTEAKWVDSLVWAGDLRLRYGQFWRYGVGPVGNDRSRLRFRLRFGPTIKIDDFTIGIRLASGNRSQVSTNQTFDTTFSGKPINLDHVFASWNPSSFQVMTLTVGKMPNPFFTHHTWEVLLDQDITPEGLAQQFAWNASPSISGFLTLGQFVLNEDIADPNQQWLLAFEGGMTLKVGGGKAGVGIGYFDATNLDQGGITELSFQQFNSRTNPSGPLPTSGYVNDYDVLNLTARFETTVMGLPVDIQGYWVKNLAYEVSCSGSGNTVGACAAGNARIRNQDEGYQVGIRVGEATKARTWEAAYYYKWLQADAVLAALADSDFGDGGTNRRGNVFWVAYNFYDFLQFRVTFINTKVLDRNLCTGLTPTDLLNACSDDIDRLLVDWNFKF
ncbi:MAG: putative porin [bacterium]